MTGFDEYANALRLRQLLKGIVKEEVDVLRPEDKFGYVYSTDIFNHSAQVVLDGDTDPITVKMSPHQRPIQTVVAADTLDSTGLPTRVRISGKPGNYWITQVLTSGEENYNLRLGNVRFQGGTFGNQPMASRHWASAGWPTVNGRTWYVGRWTNPNSFGAVMNGHIRVIAKHQFFTASNRVYEFPLATSATGGVWKLLSPVMDSGLNNGNEWDLEILVDAYYFELRVRRITQGGGYTPGGLHFDIWATIDNLQMSLGMAADEDAAPAAVTAAYWCANPAENKGPLFNTQQAWPDKANNVLTGGGSVSYTGTNAIWTARFIPMGAGKSSMVKAGYFDIDPPAGSVAIPVYADNTISTVNTVAGGVPLRSWDTLYYEPPLAAATSAFVEANLRVVAFNGGFFEVPAHWIFVATVNADFPNKVCKFGDGRSVSPWNSLSWGTNVTDYGSPYNSGVKWLNGEVHLTGLLKATGAVAAGATLFTLPAGYRPTSQLVFAAFSNGGSIRVDVHTNGVVEAPTTALVNTNWISVSGIRFPADQ